LRYLGSWDLRFFGLGHSPGVLPPLLRNCDCEAGPAGGAQDASWHAIERVRSGFLACTQLAGALAGHVAERAAERAQALPAGLKRDLGDGQVRVAQQRGRPLEPTRQQVAMWRDAERVLERACKVGLGQDRKSTR